MATFSNLVAIEGGDGSGKGTQTELLRAYVADQLHKDVLKISFPRYGEASARYAGRYLDGEYGTSEQVHPELGILPYAIDRYAASAEIREFLQQDNAFGIFDRWVASNLAHQGAKIDDREARIQFYRETLELEYEIFGVPRPKRNIVLLVPSVVAQSNVDKKDATTRSYTTKTRDIHEADASHLDKAKACFEELCELFPDEFIAIDCMDETGAQRSIDSIQSQLRRVVGV